MSDRRQPGGRLGPSGFRAEGKCVLSVLGKQVLPVQWSTEVEVRCYVEVH